MQCVCVMQDERRRRGYHESIIVPNDPGRNEQYTNRIKCLKHNARAAVVLRPQLLAQSFLLADLVGMTIAGAAMCLATGAVSGVYVTIIVVGYMLKDRMKEWGKRYLQPAAMKFGFEFPDRTVKVGLVQCWAISLSRENPLGPKWHACKPCTEVSAICIS